MLPAYLPFITRPNIIFPVGVFKTDGCIGYIVIQRIEILIILCIKNIDTIILDKTQSRGIGDKP